MAEALVIAGFLGLLVVLQVKDQKKIIVAAHFVSLFPVDVPKPDFHRPDFFGPMQFE